MGMEDACLVPILEYNGGNMDNTEGVPETDVDWILETLELGVVSLEVLMKHSFLIPTIISS